MANTKESSLLKNIDYKMTKEEKKAKISIKELKPFMKYYKKYWKSFLLGILLFSISVAIGIITPILGGNLLASFTKNFDGDLVLKLGGIILIIEIYNAFHELIINKLWNYVLLSTTVDINKAIITQINKLKVECFTTNGTGTFSGRLFRDVYTLSSTPLNILDYLSSIFSKLGFLTYTFTINWSVGLFMIAYILVYLVVQFIRENIRNKQRKILRELNDQDHSLQLENIRGIKDVRGLNTADAITKEIHKKNQYTNSVNNKFNNRSNRFGCFNRIVVSIMDFSFIALCVYLITHNEIGLAGAIIVYNYKGRVYSLGTTILGIKSYLNETALSAQRINDFYNEEKFPTETFGDKNIENIIGEVEFKNVNFEYVENSPVLNNLSFKIEPNSLTSFVGESGSGKSTIIALLNKLYTAQSGDILIDNINIHELSQDGLRNNVCIVSQSPYIFNMTLKENLLLAKPDATDEEIDNVLKDAELYDYIQTLPNKIDSKLGENGVIFSGGQKQRLAIARALLKDTKIIVLDEATSALDNINQTKIKNVIKKLSSNHTIIMIAHRLSTVVDSDNIIFLKDGQVYMQGTHSFLIENCEAYRNLYLNEDTLLSEIEEIDDNEEE